MGISLLEIELHKQSNSWILLGNFNRFNLFLIEWNYSKEIEILTIMGITIK